MTDIKPTFVDGEPECSEICAQMSPHPCGEEYPGVGYPCPPGLRAQRDALQSERDAARREVISWLISERVIIEIGTDESCEDFEHREERAWAASRGWAGLYEVKP